VGADFAAGALLAMSHLLASGYEKIFLLNPWPNYETARSFLASARQVYREIAGREFPASQEVVLHDPVQYKAFIRKLTSTKRRLGLICPEDNISCHLAQDLESRGVPLGKRHGLVSVMGTFVAKNAGLTCVRYDYHRMGRLAARMLCDGKPESILLDPELSVGLSTQA
jgi:DNA-binding LacI/PurR family transcriptional regulator